MPARWHIHNPAPALTEAATGEVIAAVAGAAFGPLREAVAPWHVVTLVPTDERVAPRAPRCATMRCAALLVPGGG